MLTRGVSSKRKREDYGTDELVRPTSPMQAQAPSERQTSSFSETADVPTDVHTIIDTAASSPLTELSSIDTPPTPALQYDSTDPVVVAPPKLSGPRPLAGGFVALKLAKPPKKVSAQPLVPLDPSAARGKAKVPQDRQCRRFYLSSKAYTQCQACRARQASSGGCRAVGLRSFLGKEPGADGLIPFIFHDSAALDPVIGTLPDVVGAFDRLDAVYALTRIHDDLAQFVRQELAHRSRSDVLYRPREKDVRPVCDACATTIFSGHALCCACMREYCLDCVDELVNVDALTEGNFHLAFCGAQTATAPKHFHNAQNMVGYTKTTAVEAMELEGQLQLVQDIFPGLTIERPAHSEASIDFVTLDELSLPFAASHRRHLDHAAFAQFWRRGEPLLLRGFDDSFAQTWTPAAFAATWGEQETELVNVVERTVWLSTVGGFFNALEAGPPPASLGGDAAAKKDPTLHLKMNDWPTVADFSIAMPDLFADFEQALPYPAYMRRKGMLNLAAYFPPDFLPPDLGPKLYCAGPSSDAPGEQGTTVLHMDMTDAINIMTWSSPSPPPAGASERPGCAVWDIFPHDALPSLKAYMQAHVVRPGELMDDPIRRARYYLTTDHLAALALPANGAVRPWRIYQRPGEAVLIPAGCAHQVCNLRGCIKVACDFVSPENVRRSWEIAQFDRRLAPLARREDVLQLKNVVYFAWRKLVAGLLDGPAGATVAVPSAEEEAEAEAEVEGKVTLADAAQNTSTRLDDLRAALLRCRAEMLQTGWAV